MRTLISLLILAAVAQGQKPPDEATLKRLLQRYVVSEDATEVQSIEAELKKIPPLTRKQADAWVNRVTRLLRSGKPKIARKGTNYFYDKKTKRGKYIISGSGNKKGLILGLHGGGVGSANCNGAASAWSGAISGMGMIGIFPEAIEATEAAWGDDVTVKFVMDLLAAATRTLKFDHDKVYVVGHSMGGYGAWTLGGRFADRFAGTVSFAGGPSCVGGPLKPTEVQAGVIPNRFNGPMWIYHSDNDGNVPIPPTRFAVSMLKQFQKEHPGGYVFNYEEVSGAGHAFPKKGPRPALKWITKFKRNPRPKKIVWESFYARPSHSYWLDNTRPSKRDRCVAVWDGKSTFKIEIEIDVRGGEYAKAMGVLLDDGMTDLGGPVKVIVDEKTVFEGVPKRSLLVLARSARSRHDPAMLFTARVP